MISVVVTSHNSEDCLLGCMQAITRSINVTFELVVVDDGSVDGSVEIAGKYADVVVELKHVGRSGARLEGLRRAKGVVVVNVDSDVVVGKKALNLVWQYFKDHPDVDAVTGRLSKKHANANFASQFKNLYMYYVFGLLPKKVTFLYGSIFALRKRVVNILEANTKTADDTEWGQVLAAHGKTIHFLPELEVVHLKKYDLWSLLKNDFRIPYDWARIFWEQRGWKQLGKGGVGFAHASKQQLISLMVLGFQFSVFGAQLFWESNPLLMLVNVVLLICWLRLNGDFFRFLFRERGPGFGVRAVIFTWFDQLVMLVGVGVGSVYYWLKRQS